MKRSCKTCIHWWPDPIPNPIKGDCCNELSCYWRDWISKNEHCSQWEQKKNKIKELPG